MVGRENAAERDSPQVSVAGPGCILRRDESLKAYTYHSHKQAVIGKLGQKLRRTRIARV